MAGRGDLNAWWRFGAAVLSALSPMLFRARVTGVEHVPMEGPTIVASNHVSVLDGIALAVVIARHRRRMTRFLTAAEFFRKPLYAWALRLYRQIPIRRGEGDEGALDEAVRTVREGALAGIFPEGKVNPSPEGPLQRGRSGVARIALATGAPVVPVGIWGTQGRWPRTGIRWQRPFRTTVALEFGPPITGEGDPDSPQDTQRLTERVMERIAERVAGARRNTR
ncbi:MAG: lysophospholipid acyltransferase family protein [Actinomycetota bacterium]